MRSVVQTVPSGVMVLLGLLLGSGLANAQDSGSITPNARDAWAPGKDSPRLITPQWVGESGVECVVTLAIDDMREPAKYEAYLRPILQRLKQIDGRAPVSIMTCNVKPDDPQLQTWLQEGLSIECHTADHPCPILAAGDLPKAKATYDRCVDLIATIPGNNPVAFRTPCCDSLNTLSPRLFSEIINKTTSQGRFLQLDSSVFTLFTADDPTIPAELLSDPDGKEKFRKYIPRNLKRGALVHDGFVNTIENYPYPYIVQGMCWEFPCVVPSDWSANHYHKPNNPDTVRDLKAALDITVLKRGTFNLVFHPHGWIKSEQVIDLIDHAVKKHGTKVKFLTFNECLVRLNKNLLNGQSLRGPKGEDNRLRLIDVDRDGLVDVVKLSDDAREQTVLRRWNPEGTRWTETAEKQPLSHQDIPEPGTFKVDLNDDGFLDLVVSNAASYGIALFDPATKTFPPPPSFLKNRQDGLSDDNLLPVLIRADGSDNGFFVKGRNLLWINEDTDDLPDFTRRIAFDQLLGDRMPEAKSPEAAKASMHVAPGYRVDLVAQEPLTMDPVAMDWGPDGKMWVAEMADYPRGIDGQGKPGGRIRFLEDTNNDGIYDKSTLFLEDVPFPNGVLSWKKGVLVSAAPDIFYAEDSDGDGKADVRKVLFTGFAEGNQQHRVNGFARGVDNWIYLANGDSGGLVRVVGALRDKAPDSPDQPNGIEIRSRDVRIRPDTGEIEAIAGQSQFGRNRDDWGNWFGNNNSRPMWHYVLDEHYLKRNPHLVSPNLQRDVSVTPGASPVFPTSRTLTRFNDFHTANRFTSACSTMVYRDHLIGEPADSDAVQVFISEPVHNLVHREVMRPEGASFTSRRAASEESSEFLTSTDNWFRPTQIKTGPDGALYIADMYRLVIEHPQWIPIEWQRKLDLRAGHDRGRIWRVSPMRGSLRSIPRLDRMTTAELVDVLSSPNGWQRDLAQQLLIDRADAAAIPLLVAQLTELVHRPAAGPQAAFDLTALGKIHSLGVLDGITRNRKLHDPARQALQQALPILLTDSHAGVRRWAIRFCELFPQLGENLWPPLGRLINDADTQVQLQLAYSLGELKHSEAGSALGRLALRAQGNGYLVTAILSSLNSDNLEPVLAVVMQNGTGQTELLQQLLGQATAFNNEPALVRLLTRATEPAKSPSDPNSAAELQVLPGGFARWQYSSVEQFLLSLDRRFKSLEQWLSGLSADARPVAGRLQEFFANARKLAANEDANASDRVTAIRVLGRTSDTRDDVALLSELLAPRNPPELQSAAVATLARVKSPEIARTLLSNFRSFAPSLRGQVCNVLLSRDTWQDELLKALESRDIAPTDLDAASRQRLLDHKTKAISDRAAKILQVDLNSNRAKLVAEYLPTVRMGGDVQLGSQIFKKTCSQCHKLGDTGHAVGPDLVSLTDKSPDALLAAVLDPNRAVESKFLTFVAITKTGVTHTGILATETASSITLRAAEGKEVTLLRSEIDELQGSTKSLMPEGLERDLKPADAAALVAYIRLNVPLPARKTFPGNEPKVVAADDQGKLTLLPHDAEVYGPTIVIEEQYRNLGWWSSADDIAVWTINVPQAGNYSIGWTYACEPTAAGNRVVVDAAGKSLTRRVESTGSWENYQLQSLGELDLPAGEVRLTLKPASRPLPALADVKSLVITPRK